MARTRALSPQTRRGGQSGGGAQRQSWPDLTAYGVDAPCQMLRTVPIGERQVRSAWWICQEQRLGARPPADHPVKVNDELKLAQEGILQ